MRPTLSLPLKDHVSSPTRARCSARELMAPLASFECAADTGLLVTELVANAVVHGGPPIHLEIVVHRTFIGIEVFDSSEALPVMRGVGGTDTAGRGLRLVDAIASSWGTRTRLDGKVVWCELLRDQAESLPIGQRSAGS